MEEFLSKITFSQFLIFTTVLMMLFLFKRKKKVHILLLLIVTVCLGTEMLTNFFIINSIGFGALYSISAVIHNVLWFAVLFSIIERLRYLKILILAYVLLAIINFLFIEGRLQFNVYSFALGAVLYLIIFISENIIQLQRENFLFFEKNESLLLYTPLLLFIAMSIVLGFRDTQLSDKKIIYGLSLYDLIISFANILYYSIITIYIYREKKLEK
ncbi:hypothetical protein AAEO56_16485 [Flavobacterium sp. DGU11]|uniref:YhhN-like protein n=1 Tax=Flavobacterium arundinis TaxID=3139143 RepID=A0ABU9I1R7_9FLAO